MTEKVLFKEYDGFKVFRVLEYREMGENGNETTPQRPKLPCPGQDYHLPIGNSYIQSDKSVAVDTFLKIQETELIVLAHSSPIFHFYTP